MQPPVLRPDLHTDRPEQSRDSLDIFSRRSVDRLQPLVTSKRDQQDTEAGWDDEGLWIEFGHDSEDDREALDE